MTLPHSYSFSEGVNGKVGSNGIIPYTYARAMWQAIGIQTQESTCQDVLAVLCDRPTFNQLLSSIVDCNLMYGPLVNPSV